MNGELLELDSVVDNSHELLLRVPVEAGQVLWHQSSSKWWVMNGGIIGA